MPPRRSFMCNEHRALPSYRRRAFAWMANHQPSLQINGYRWIEGMEDLLLDLRKSGVEMHIITNYPVILLSAQIPNSQRCKPRNYNQAGLAIHCLQLIQPCRCTNCWPLYCERPINLLLNCIREQLPPHMRFPPGNHLARGNGVVPGCLFLGAWANYLTQRTACPKACLLCRCGISG